MRSNKCACENFVQLVNKYAKTCVKTVESIILKWQYSNVAKLQKVVVVVLFFWWTVYDGTSPFFPISNSTVKANSLLI